MAQTELDLAALISSRICHDLISPIGAINNGLELLGMSGQSLDTPEMSLINESVQNASARIRFFRIAYGAASEQEIGRAEVISILNDMMGGGRLSVEWGPLEGQPRDVVRLALLAIQCLETAMPYGGRIEVSSSRKQWKIHGKSEKFNQIDNLWSAVSSVETASDIAPAHVQFALLPAAAKEQNRDVRVTRTATDITIQF
jgi:histidine phosphotransferase ChpT|tara:strand:+ start:1995 stop:2594 length:600 start_codon:yes stop_codon:yes gene_type:complete